MKFSRRSFFGRLTLGVLGVSAATQIERLFPTANAADAKLPAAPKSCKKVATSKKGMGKSLGYVDVAEDAKNGKYKKKYKAGDNCVGCKFYTKTDDNYGKCKMIPGHCVTAKGWCKSFKANKKKA